MAFTKTAIVILMIGLLTLLLTAFTPPMQEGDSPRKPRTQARPDLSGPVEKLETAHFVIHYTLDGDDAVDPTDADDSDHPDYVEAVAESLEYSWEQLITVRGWPSPLLDRNEGGTDRFDIYLQNQRFFLGYVDTNSGTVGDDPNTPTVETYAAYGYMGLDNDYAEVELYGEEYTPDEIMRATVAHELHHAIQATFDNRDTHRWLYEATSVWVEDEVYPGEGDSLEYLDDYLTAPDICPLSVGRDFDDLRWYGAWILLRYLTDHHGGHETVQHLWREMVDLEGGEALEKIVVAQGTTLPDLLSDFSVANLTQSDCPANAPYCYQRGSDYPIARVEETVRVAPGQRRQFRPDDGVQQLATDYIRLRAEQPVLIDFAGSEAGLWQLRAVGLNGDEADVHIVAPDGLTTVDPSAYERMYLVVVNAAAVAEEVDCAYHNYALGLADATLYETAVAPDPAPNPGRYVPPRLGFDDEEAAIPDREQIDGTEIDPTAAAFEVLHAGYLPENYESEVWLSYTLADVGDLYAPGGAPIIALEYRGSAAEADAYLAFTQSQSPHDDLWQWVEEQGVPRNDVRLILDQPVYLETFDSETPRSRATLIHNRLFVVIDGSFDRVEMQQVVAGLLLRNP